MTKNLKGIYDPWRIYSHDREEDPQNVTEPSLPSHMHSSDADLLPRKEFMFRHSQAIGDILINGADEPVGAAQCLMQIIHACPEFQTLLREKGFEWGRHANVNMKGFVIKTKDYALTLPDARSMADGLSYLVTTIRQSSLQKQLEKMGIIILLK